jgi:hypothetical protein
MSKLSAALLAISSFPAPDSSLVCSGLSDSIGAVYPAAYVGADDGGGGGGGYYSEDLAVLGYYGPIGALSPAVGARHPAHPAHYAPHPHAPAHPAAHPALAMPYPAAVAQRMFNPAPGAPNHQAGFRPLSLLQGAFINGGAIVLPFNQTPRHQFQGRRLTYTERRTAAANVLVTIDNFAIGGNLQFEAAGALGADTFLPNSYDTDMKLTPCGPGVFLTGNVIASVAPAANERIDFTLSLHGEVLY